MPNYKSKTIQLTGHTYGLLTVDSFAWIDKHKRAVWNVTCLCGKKFQVPGYVMRQRAQISCGCLRQYRFKKIQEMCKGKDIGWEPELNRVIMECYKGELAAKRLKGFKVTTKTPEVLQAETLLREVF